MDKKRIGLCVCYDQKNFGSQLQVFATQEAVKKMGFDFEIIRYKKKLTPVFILKSLPRLFNGYFVNGKINRYKKNREIAKHPEVKKQVNLRNKRFKVFADHYFENLSKEYYGYEELKKGAKAFDGFLTGSDQLWLPNNLGSHFYTQEFVPDNINKVAYATSFGVSTIPWYQTKRTGNYLKRFNHLSSRELKGCEIIKSLTGREVETVVDPTLLFTGDEWISLIESKPVVEGKYIFCYFLGRLPKYREEAEKLAGETGMKIVTIPFLNNYIEKDETFGDIQLYDIDSADFVNLIRHAEYVVTDSFHGSVFSILNHKQFITCNRFEDGDKASRNSRIDSLCSLLGLSERRYQGDITSRMMMPLDYVAVDERLMQLRNNSWKYLESSLND